MVRVKRVNDKLLLLVDYHEWAGSRRTSGMPVYAILRSGDWILLGETVKKATSYEFPDDALCVVRVYWSNRGIHYFYIYYPLAENIREYKISESDLAFEDLPEEVRGHVRKFVEWWLFGE